MSTSNSKHFPCVGTRALRSHTRRDFLYGLGASAGSLALTSMLAAEESRKASSPLAKKPAHFPNAKAKNCIFLMMEGGPSHIDTFDPKPKLDQLHLVEPGNQGDDKDKSLLQKGRRYFVKSPFTFQQHGQSGAWMSDPWVHLPSVADDICFFRGCQVDSVNHPTAMFQMNTGNRFGGDPGIGAWVNYGLGTENQNLPGFIVMPEVSYPQGGSPNWGSGYLPAVYQGTALRPNGSPILDLQPPEEIKRAHQRRNLDLISSLDRQHADKHPYHDVLDARISNYELAFRMQMQVPDALDLSGEDARTQASYGIGRPETDAFGRKCLLARKLVEKGVRFIQLYAGLWDSHDYIERAHRNLITQVDQPIAALLADLKQRGLLDETLVIWCGEFGRTPDNGERSNATALGRDHNANAMPVWLAGGGVKAGHTIGATDETGATAVECVHHVRDLHVTLLRLLGLDDNRLTYYHGGRFKQLSQFGGKVIEELIA